ncbi:M15 family metallopeptidase [Paenibacillus protaetiae]|uniref:M15 family peptidase n=1 Tax=Paenibacillus protaetiae TaxID=2509456 RepID=A0A4P6EX61_9BACL|nr:M15 family metallopeptidase [Paenibacillus protaetiae]QAY67235.1 M15 family peptidase [Paenibacillus protaetiae]
MLQLRSHASHKVPMKNKWIGLLLLAAGLLVMARLIPDEWQPGNDPKVLETSDLSLNPIVEHKKDQLVAQAAQAGIKLIISDGFRSAADQNKLYAQGRTAPGKVVTNARGGQSYHNYGLAVDFALLDHKGKALWDLNYDGNRNGKADWMEVVALAKKLGFDWGGDWDSPDYPHLEMNFGLSIRDLQRGKLPPVE